MNRFLILTLCLILTSLVAGFEDGAAQPSITVLNFPSEVDNPLWTPAMAAAAEKVFVMELVKSGTYRVIDREQLSTLLPEEDLPSQCDEMIEEMKKLGVQYCLTGEVGAYGVLESGLGQRKAFVAAIKARLIDTATGKTIWRDESRKVSPFGIAGGVTNQRMFDKVMKPAIRKLVASILQHQRV